MFGVIYATGLFVAFLGDISIHIEIRLKYEKKYSVVQL
jgi:hypothetical protein